MIKVGITGQIGFIGTHLYNTLGLFPDKYTLIPFEDSFFQSEDLLNDFVSQCDVIVHLAAVNRHNEPEWIYNTNIKLVKQLIGSCETTHSKPHIIFSSSTQEERENIYGRSKREGRELFMQWAEKNHSIFSGLIIPNVFGPFGHPYYNSVVATFCHQLTHNEQPKIDIDGEMKLIYVGELVNEILFTINQPFSNTKYVPHTAVIKVSELLSKLTEINYNYFNTGEIPSLDNNFNRNLFNTFLSYIDYNNFFPYHLKLNTDNRGIFVEAVKLNSGGQVSFSSTKPGITRGNHFHTRKAERFAVIKGKALIKFRRIGTYETLSFELNDKSPSFVDMPIWYTHNITNIGNDELYTLFWINEHFVATDPDTFFETV